MKGRDTRALYTGACGAFTGLLDVPLLFQSICAHAIQSLEAANSIDPRDTPGVPRHIFVITHAPVYRNDHSSDDPFDNVVPHQIRSLGPWQGGAEGEMANLRPHYRRFVEEQGWAIVVSTTAEFKPEIA